MNKKEALKVFKWRQGLVNSLDDIINAVKKSNELASKHAGQMGLFDAVDEVMDEIKEYPKVKIPEYIDIMEAVNIETELLGIPFSYDPVDDCTMYEDIYCSHNPAQLLELTEDCEVVILGRIVDIERRVSKKSGNPYVKVRISALPENYYFYLTGKRYKSYIISLFINEIYIIRISYSLPTIDYPYESFSIERIENVKDLNIDKRIEELYNSCEVKELDEPWMIKNRNSK